MKLTLLGTGTPAPSLKRMSSGYLLEIGDDVIIIDHGPGAHHRFLELGRKATEVTHCFLSHLHYDHCMDYGRLLMTRWDQSDGTLPELEVFAPPPIKRMTEQLIGPDGVYGPDLAARTSQSASLDIYAARGGTLPRNRPAPEVRELEVGETIETANWRLTVGAGWHAQPELNCFAYRFDCAEGSVCYSGDSGGVCPGIVDLAKGADVLIHMNHYFSGTEPNEAYRRFCGNHADTAKVAAQAGVGTVVLTHMTDQIDHPGLREQIIAEMSKTYAGTIVWGEDLLEVPIKPITLGRID